MHKGLTHLNCGSQRSKETWKSLTVILFRAGVTEPEKGHLDSCSRSNAMTSDIFTKDDITPKLKHLTIQLEQSHINLNSLNNDLLELLMEGDLNHLRVTEPYFSCLLIPDLQRSSPLPTKLPLTS